MVAEVRRSALIVSNQPLNVSLAKVRHSSENGNPDFSRQKLDARFRRNEAQGQPAKKRRLLTVVKPADHLSLRGCCQPFRREWSIILVPMNSATAQTSSGRQ